MKCDKRIFLLFVFLSLPVYSRAQLWSSLLKPTSGTGACSPASASSPQRCGIDWSAVGVVGGIPTRSACTTSACNAVTSAGGNATATQIQAALNSAPAGSAVVLPAGNYTLSSDIQVPSNVTLRGAGPQSTIITYTGRTGFPIYAGSTSGGDTPNMASATNISSGANAGSTSVSVSSTANISVGGLLVISEVNNPVSISVTTLNGTCTWCDAYLFHDTGSRVRGQTVKVTSVSGNTVGFTPALYTSYGVDPGTSPAMASPYGVSSGSSPDAVMAGIESLQLYGTNSAPNSSVNGSMLTLRMCDECWVKNVEVNWSDSDQLDVDYCYRCEVDNNYFSNAFVHQSGGSDAEVRVGSWSSGVLVQNNILERLHTSFLFEWGPAGNVFAYNYSCCTFDSIANNVLNEDVAFHGANPQFNLFEGNVMDDLNLDAFWGSSSNTTAFRNLMRGAATIAPYTDGSYVASGPAHKAINWSATHIANQQNRSVTVTYENTNVNLIGNVFGSADAITAVGGTGNLFNSGLPPFTSTAVPPTTRNYNGTYYATNFGYNTGSDSNGSLLTSIIGGLTSTAGYWVGLAFDSSLQHGNFDIASKSTIWTSGISNTLPASMYLSSKPSWFGSVTWPPIGPDVSGGPDSTVGGHAYNIPAQVCYQKLSRDSSGVKAFDANSCYGTQGTQPAPPAPTGLTGVVIQ